MNKSDEQHEVETSLHLVDHEVRRTKYELWSFKMFGLILYLVAAVLVVFHFTETYDALLMRNKVFFGIVAVLVIGLDLYAVFSIQPTKRRLSRLQDQSVALSTERDRLAYRQLMRVPKWQTQK